MELYIARHGETEFNALKRLQGGGLDTPLTQTGILQAKGLGKSIEGINFDAIYSSPLKRAMDTACIAFNDQTLFSGKLFGKKTFTDPRLVEIGLGDAEGLLWDNEMVNISANPVEYIPPPGGEKLEDMIDRLDSFLQELATKDYKKVFVLAHGYVMRVVYSCSVDKSLSAIGDAPFFENCEIVKYLHDGFSWNLFDC